MPSKREMVNAMNGAIRKAIRDWDEAKADGDEDTIAMYRTDAADLGTVKIHIQAGRIKAAYRKACDMDTAARDAIPDIVWYVISSN